MAQRFLIKKLEHHRRIRDQPLHLRVPTIQNPQGIGVQTPLAVLVELGGVGLEVGNQLAAVDLSRPRGPQRVDFE